MKKLLSILFMALSFSAFGQGAIQSINQRVAYLIIGGKDGSIIAKDTVIRAQDSAYCFIAKKANKLMWFDSTQGKSWHEVSGDNNVVYVDTLTRSNDSLYLHKDGQIISLGLFKNLENSNLTLPNSRIVNLNGKALVFQDGVTHYDFDGSLMTLYIGDIDGNSTEIQQSSTNVNISATSPDDNASFGFAPDLVNMSINDGDIQITEDSIKADQNIRAKTFQTEMAKTKILDGGVVVQDNTDVTVSYMLGKNVGGYVYDGFAINPADVVTFGLGGSTFYNILDSARPTFRNGAGIDRRYLLEGDAIIGGGMVSSFNTRTGAVTSVVGDYSAFYPQLSGSYDNPSWITSLPWSKITSTPTTKSGYGITDMPSYSDTVNLFGSAAKRDTAYFSNIMSAAFSGSATKTLTLTKRNGSVITASFTDSVGAGVPAITAGYVAYGTGTGITGTAGNQYAETSTLSTLSLGNRTVGNVGLIDFYSSAAVAGKISINNGLNLRHGTSAGSYIFVDNMSGGTGKLSNVSGESFPNSSTFGWTGNSVIRGVISSFINPATSSKLISGYTSSQNAAAVQSIGPMWMNPQAADPTSADGMFWSTTGGYFKGQIGGAVKNFVMGTASTPTGTADASGTQGDIKYDDSYIYIKTSAGWKRTALSTF